MRTGIATFLGLLVAGAGSVARADPSTALSLASEEDQIIVNARGALPKNGQIKARGLWIDVELAQSAGTARIVVDDSTIKRVDLVTGEQPRLSILLHRDMKSDRFAAAARVEVTDNGMRVFMPRDPKRALGTQQPLLPREIASDRPGCTVALTAPSPVPPKAVVETPAAPPSPRLPVEALGLAPQSEEHSIAGASESSFSPLPALALLLLVLGGAAVLVIARRRKGAPVSSEKIRIVSQTLVGPKVRLVLVAVGDREMLLSVTDKGAQPVGRWRRAAPSAAEVDAPADIAPPSAAPIAPPSVRLVSVPARVRAEAARATEPKVIVDGIPDIDIALPAPVRSDSQQAGASRKSADAGAPQTVAAGHQPVTNFASPAVAGLLRLRRPVDPEDVASGDPQADEEWARELLAAMRGQGAA